MKLRANAFAMSVTQRADPPSGFEPGHQRHTTRAVLKPSAAVAVLLLSACAGNEPVAVDTACDRFAHISFTDQQIAAVKADWTTWESAADQIVSHNIEFDKRCLGLPPVKRT